VQFIPNDTVLGQLMNTSLIKQLKEEHSNSNSGKSSATNNTCRSLPSSVENKEPLLLLVTGPNMGGKSTLLR